MTIEDTVPPGEARARRIRELALLCALDRVNLRLTLRPVTPPPEEPPPAAGESLRRVLGVTRHVPGVIGRWSRRIAFGASLLNALR